MQNQTKKTIAIIPARGGSKRIPRKNILDFMGKPMIVHTLEAAINSQIFDTIHVSTDDDEIAKIAQDCGVDLSFRRPAHLADDMTGILPVANFVLKEFANRNQFFDTVFILFPCSPLIEPEDLKGAHQIYNKHNGNKNLLTIAKCPVPKEWLYHVDEAQNLIPTTPGGAFIRSQDLQTAYYETGTFTIFSAQYLLNETEFNDDTNYIGYLLDEWKCVDIDTPDDLDRAALLYRLNKAKNDDL